MRVSELKRTLRPLFKDRLNRINGGWNNVKSVEKNRTLLLEFTDIKTPENQALNAQLKADVNATIQGNFPDCDIRFDVEYIEYVQEAGEAITYESGKVIAAAEKKDQCPQ